jgi:hypothetical protein
VNKKAGFSPTEKGDYSGTQRGPRQMKVYEYGTRRKLSFSLRKYTTLFQAIKAYSVHTVEGAYENRDIHILFNRLRSKHLTVIKSILN